MMQGLLQGGRPTRWMAGFGGRAFGDRVWRERPLQGTALVVITLHHSGRARWRLCKKASTIPGCHLLATNLLAETGWKWPHWLVTGSFVMPAASPTPDSPVLELHDVRKTYSEGTSERAVLQGLSLTIDRGEAVVLMGRSGAGKSTLLNLVSGIDLPTSGTIVVHGTDLTALSETERTLFRRTNIGFVFQSFNLISTLTAFENVLLPLELAGASSADARQQAEGVLAHVGLGDRGDSFPDRLSGGEQQRVAIARALAHDPLFVLADEPTGNLDYETGQQVLALLDDLVRETGTTLLVATHDREALDRADRVLHLRGGILHAGIPDFLAETDRPTSE
jgi:putative ABC transport system ATP-binding protein